MSNSIAIIGGSTIGQLDNLTIDDEFLPTTPYGEPETALVIGQLNGMPVTFMNRRGDHRIPAHRINYRANIWALHTVGVKQIIAVVGMGGIRADMVPGKFAVPDQLIDYTYDRDATYYDECAIPVEQIDFTYPFSDQIRAALTKSARRLDKTVSDEATVGVTQGPRFETLAEIKRLERDGCDLVSMTPIPEVVLARELSMEYACLALVTNKAAGRRQGREAGSNSQQVVDTKVANLHTILADSLELLLKDVNTG